MNPGARLGPYEVVSSLGAGGMGEVYKARDTRLDREVAIKILPVDYPPGRSAPYAVMPDGQRFLLNTRGQDPTTFSLSLVVNWPAAIAAK